MSIVSSFNVSATAGPLGAYLAEGSTSPGLFGALNTITSNASLTAQALGAGRLTNSQHNVIQAIGSSADGTLAIGWNANGSEPTTLSALRAYGWIRLTKKGYDATTKTATGTYALTTVGKAIFNRTGGPAIGAGASDLTSSLNSSTSAAALTSSLQQSVTSIASALSSFGVNITV